MPTVMIIGASRGIGLEFARQYAEAGWTVLATTRTPSEPGQLGDLTGDICLFELDVVNPEHIEKLVASLTGTPIDVLIHNSGIAVGDPWDYMEAVNVVAPRVITQALTPNVQISEQKKIAIIGSGAGRLSAGDDIHPYGKSKRMLHAEFRERAPAWKKLGIKAIVFGPGRVKTDMTRHQGIEAEDSIGGMREVLDKLTWDQHGTFISYTGEERDW